MESLFELEEYALKHNLGVTVCSSGKHVFAEGRAAKGVYYLLDNQVKIFKHGHNGNTIFLWFARPKELIGLTSFFQGGGNYTCSAITDEKPSRFIFFSNDDFENLLKQYPVFKHKLLRMLCERISFMEKRTKNMLYHSIDERITESLVFLVAKANSEMNTNVQKNLKIYYTKKEFAVMVGASVDYLRRKLKELKSKEIIDYGRNWLLIKDINRLRAKDKKIIY